MGLRRWISSMKSTSPGLRFVSRPARSPGLSRTGPEVTLSWECISLAMMLASVVLPSPGGPCSNTWSSESPRIRAAWMKMRRFSTIFSCPAKFCNSCGRILFSNSRSLSMFRIVDMVTKGNRMFRYAVCSGTVFHFPVAGIRSGGCIYGYVFPACGLTVTGCGCRYPKHAIVLQIYLFFGKSPHSPLQKTPSSPSRGDAADFSRQGKRPVRRSGQTFRLNHLLIEMGCVYSGVIDQRRTQIPVEILIAGV